jgi:formate/nitrite transporter FocA (FNT family)
VPSLFIPTYKCDFLLTLIYIVKTISIAIVFTSLYIRQSLNVLNWTNGNRGISIIITKLNRKSLLQYVYSYVLSNLLVLTSVWAILQPDERVTKLSFMRIRVIMNMYLKISEVLNNIFKQRISWFIS